VSDRCAPVAARQQLLAELWSTPLYQAITSLMATGSTQAGASNSTAGNVPGRSPPNCESLLAEKATFLLLLRRPSSWPASWGPAEAGAWQTLMDTSHLSILEAELSYLREQAEHIEEVLSEGGDMEARCGSGCAQKLDCAAHGHLGATSNTSTRGSSLITEVHNKAS
jgi:hypothetical protein